MANEGVSVELMCHLILIMPIAALSLFWMFPLSTAGPLYAAITLPSLALYGVLFKMMRKPVVTGKEGIIHASGVVERVDEDTLSVRVHGEHWTARSADERLEPGDPVEVIDIDGLTLGVRRRNG